MKPTVLHKCCVFLQSKWDNGITYTYIHQVNTTPHLGYFLSVQNWREKIQKNIKYTKYRHYFCATPYISLDFKHVRKFDKNDY